MDRRYLASLAGAAVAILVVGVLIKPTDAIRGAMHGEAAPLQHLSQEGDLRSEAAYFAERLSAVEDQVVYLSDAQASGVRWTGVAGIVTTGPGRPVDVVTATTDSASVPAAAAADAPGRSRWVLVVARLADNRTVSATALHGGIAPARCGDDVVQEMVLSAPLHAAFAGGGLFDLNGKRLGLVVRCPHGLVAIPAAEVDRLLNLTRSVAWRLLDRRGIGVVPLDAVSRAQFKADSGVVISAVRGNTTAASWNLRPGDVIERIGDSVVNNPDDLRLLLDDPVSIDVVRLRRGERSRIGLSSKRVDTPAVQGTPALALTASGDGVVITALGQETAAYRAGVRSGDVVIEVDGALNPTMSVIRSVLLRADTVAHFLVVQRGDTQRGIVLQARGS